MKSMTSEELEISPVSPLSTKAVDILIRDSWATCSKEHFVERPLTARGEMASQRGERQTLKSDNSIHSRKARKHLHVSEVR